MIVERGPTLFPPGSTCRWCRLALLWLTLVQAASCNAAVNGGDELQADRVVGTYIIDGARTDGILRGIRNNTSGLSLRGDGTATINHEFCVGGRGIFRDDLRWSIEGKIAVITDANGELYAEMTFAPSRCGKHEVDRAMGGTTSYSAGAHCPTNVQDLGHAGVACDFAPCDEVSNDCIEEWADR